MNPASRPAPLVLIGASAVFGHFFVVTPLVDAARGILRGAPRCPVVECTAEARPLLMETTMMTVAPPAPPPPMAMEPESAPWPPGAPWAARFHASSLQSREIWRGEFMGVVEPMGPHLSVRLHRLQVALGPEAPAGVLRGLRIDLAEPTPDGSWRIVREGRPVDVKLRMRNGESARLARVDLPVPNVGGVELRGRWLVVTMLVDAPGGFSPLAHAHMDFAMAQGVAETAIRAEANAPAVRVR